MGTSIHWNQRKLNGRVWPLDSHSIPLGGGNVLNRCLLSSNKREEEEEEDYAEEEGREGKEEEQQQRHPAEAELAPQILSRSSETIICSS